MVGGAITCAIPAVWASLPARMLVFWISFGFVSAAVEGLVSSIYTAGKAAHLDPVESRRYE